MAKQVNQPNKPSAERSVVVPSQMIVPTKAEEGQVEGFQAVEIAAQVTLPVDGGWGWVVVACATVGVTIVDGVAYTFGPLLPEMCQEFGVPESKGTFVISTALGVYYIMSPVASALINRFSFRAIGMAGSILMCCGLYGSYTCGSVFSLIFFYGIVNGLGLSLASLAVTIVCGFYFEKLRSIALGIVSSGTSMGTMIFYPVNDIFVKACGWRTTILFHSGISGIVYFMSLSFKPLVSLTVTTIEEEGNPTRTVTLLPTVTNEQERIIDRMVPEPQTRLKVVSNAYFPTAAKVIDTQTALNTSVRVGTSSGPSSPYKGVSRISIKTTTAASKDQILKIQSVVMSRRNLQNQDKSLPATPMEIIVDVKEKPAEKSCFARCCDWDSSPSEERPMYRDDAFYTGKIEDLPVYKDNVQNVVEKDKIGLEYQMAVTRAAAVDDLEERGKGLCTTAASRIMASMFDPTLMKITSFVMYCLAGFMLYFGVMIPYVYTQARAVQNGVDNSQASLLVSVIALATMAGRITTGFLIGKFHPLTLWGLGSLVAGVSTMMSSLSYTTVYQMCYAVVFGFAIAPTSSLRSVIIVECYGLESLTNGTGIMLLFIGVANLLGTPAMAALKDAFGIEMAFYSAGGFITVAGLMCLLPVQLQLRREKAKNSTLAKENVIS